MSETAVERRLREIVKHLRDDASTLAMQPVASTYAIDAGREAIVLIRRMLDEIDGNEFINRTTRADVAALLARCEGES